MKHVVNKFILKVNPYVPGKPIEEVRRKLGLKKVYKLASNENPYGPSSKVLKAIAKASKNLNRYPLSDCFYLRSALSKQLKVNPEQLIFGNGSDELIVLAIKAFVSKGDEVVIARPSFLIYEIASKLSGAKIKSIPLKNFVYDLEAMQKAVTKKTKIVFLGNPDNPAGSYFTKKDIVGFLNGISKNVLVFIDEAYFEFVTEKDYVDSIALLKKYKNVIVTRTFSKMYGLAGLRIGYGITTKEIASLINRVREPFNVNSLAQAAALACLKDKKYYKEVARKVINQRKYLCSQIKKLGLSTIESYTNFILIDVKTDSKKLSQKLLKKGVIVRDMSVWGMKTFIRVSIGSSIENRLFIKHLKNLA